MTTRSAVAVAGKTIKDRRRHSTIGECGTRGDDVSGDVTDDAVGVRVAGWLLAKLGAGVVSNRQVGTLDVDEVLVRTGYAAPRRRLGDAMNDRPRIYTTVFQKQRDPYNSSLM